MVQHMQRFDLFDVDAYEEVLTGIVRDMTETIIKVLNQVGETKCPTSDSFC